MSGPIVEVEGLSVSFDGVRAVRDVALEVRPGECVALVGESGSGKSVTARALLGLAGPGAEVRAGRLRIDGADALGYGERQWRQVRGRRIGYVLQDALVSLDPLRRIGDEIAEPLRLNRVVPRSRVDARVLELLSLVGVPEPEMRARQYPHQLSGGLRQRALIASAIACDPALLIADEPTTALDVTVQARILALLAERKRSGTALLLISHDLAVVAEVADRVLVMREGEIVEEGPVGRVLTEPGHDYTRTLLAAVPTPERKGGRLSVVEGDAPRSAGRKGTDAPPRSPGEVLVEADGLTKAFGGRRVVGDVSFELRAGETLGLVGESGSGKTTIARMVLGLLAPDAGRTLVGGRSWDEAGRRGRRALRREIQVIYQDPLGSFDPRFTVEQVLDEALAVGGVPRRRRRERAAELLSQVGLAPAVLARRPRSLSGGQRQRVAIARALAPGPRVIVCDEPVSALDVSVQAQVLDLLKDLQDDQGVAYLFISHHLGVVRHMSDRVVVLDQGRVVESGDVTRVFTEPRAERTRDLLASVPSLPGTKPATAPPLSQS